MNRLAVIQRGTREIKARSVELWSLLLFQIYIMKGDQIEIVAGTAVSGRNAEGILVSPFVLNYLGQNR